MSGRIEVDPLLIRQTAKKLKARAGVIQREAAAAGKTVENDLGRMVSKRLDKDIAYWRDLKKEIDQAVQLLEKLSTELTKAADGFKGVDEQGGL